VPCDHLRGDLVGSPFVKRALAALVLAGMGGLMGACTTINVSTGTTTTTATPSISGTAHFRIGGGNMEPTYKPGQGVTVRPIEDFGADVRGWVVVFTAPPTENCEGSSDRYLVSRIIGLPGDVISLSGGYVYIGGSKLMETWLPTPEQGVTHPGPSGSSNLASPYTVPSDSYFVMGDNRTDSCDSRFWGPVAVSDIVGVSR
jgi:signal peptidase I